ncbi:MAG: DEAD/DEAH box helicase [Deltaproteobacteria bacterium]|nr:DEAD/DEAH box helicase [Deltaproteobacteria bacterium]
MQELFEAVREACSRGVWSNGVELARASAVSGESESGDEITLRVAQRGGLVAPAVTLHLRDAEWTCDCASTDDPCVHVAAAVIALRRAREAGAALPSARGAPGRIGYRLSRENGALAIERVVVQGDRESRLPATLAAVASGRVEGPAFLATEADVEIERALGSKLRGAIEPQAMSRVLTALAAAQDVRLGSAPVHTSAERALPLGVVEDQGDGFRLSVIRDPRTTETFSNGAALYGDELRALGESSLSGREREELPRGVHFGVDGLPHLVSEVLPALERRIPVEVRTQRLPRRATEPPRILLDVQREGDDLAVLAALVYGRPPTARVDAGRLVHLGGALPLRDEAAEARLVRELATELELAPGHRTRLSGADAVRFARRLERFSGELRGRGHEDFFEAPPLEPRFRVTEDGFDLRFETGDIAAAGMDERGGAGSAEGAAGARSGVATIGAEAVLHAWRAGEPLVALPGAGFAPLPADWLARFGARIAELLAARDANGRLPRAALPDLARLCDALGEPRPPAFEGLRALVDGFERIPAAALPADLTATLRDYQRRGADWLCFLRDAGLGALLADDMGLGKTLEALCAIRGRTLVIAPTSVLHGWQDETRRFRPALRTCTYHGTKRALDSEADVTITTYALLRLDADRLANERWDTIVFDEAQFLKNPDSQVARAALALDADFRVALTGTPVENRLEELWSEMNLVCRGLLGSREDFDARVARPVAAGEPGAAARLRERIRPFVLRRTKAEVAPELPPRTDVVLRCILGEEERTVYDAVRAATLREVREKLAAGGGMMAALEALLRLRQAACDARLVPGQHADRSAKLDLLVETLDEIVAEGHKALVFSQWTSLLDLAEPELARAGIGFLRLDGATRDRGAVVAEFQSPAGPPVLLISLRAGGVGLNLTAADHVFLLDPWWNPAVEDQAADRAHRIGQDRPVIVHRLVAEDTVEERILALQERKRDLARAALGEAGAATAITREDLLALLAE